MSKDLFEQMRAAEVATFNFLPTKKEIVISANQFAEQLIDSGDHNIEEMFSQALRMNEALSVITGKLKEALPQENFEAFGVKGSYRIGGDLPQFADDEKWSILHKKLKDREALLKTALKSDEEIYDSEGVKVEKVSTKPRKSSLNISF